MCSFGKYCSHVVVVGSTVQQDDRPWSSCLAGQRPTDTVVGMKSDRLGQNSFDQGRFEVGALMGFTEEVNRAR